jgi:hypothetical protein
MAKPNYAFEKRQRELAKKKKKEEKALRKTQPRPDGEAAPDDEVDAPDAGATPGEAPGGTPGAPDQPAR